MASPVIFLILLGFIVGTLGTLIGAGGGFILVPVLLMVYPNQPPEVLTSISLAVVFLNALSGSAAYAKMKRIDYRSAFIFGMATLPGAIIGANITGYLPIHLFNKILGGLLMIISLYLFFRPAAKAHTAHHDKKDATERHITDAKGTSYHYSFSLWKGLVISFFVGFLSSLLGIGGGIIHVPALTNILYFPVHIATATSHLMLALMALAGTVVHIINGTLHFSEIKIALYIGAGVVLGAQLGAYLSHKVRSNFIIRSLAFALFVVGLRMMF